MIELKKIRLSIRCNWMAAMPNYTYEYRQKHGPLVPFVEKFAKISLLETARRPEIENSQGAYFQQKRKSNTTIQTNWEKKKKK